MDDADDESKSLSAMIRDLRMPTNDRAIALLKNGGMPALEAERERAREGMRRLREARRSDPHTRMVTARKAFLDLESEDRDGFLEWCAGWKAAPRKPKAMSATLFKRKFLELRERYGDPPDEGEFEGRQAFTELFDSSELSWERIEEIMGWSKKEKPAASAKPRKSQAAKPDPSTVPIAMPDLSNSPPTFDDPLDEATTEPESAPRKSAATTEFRIDKKHLTEKEVQALSRAARDTAGDAAAYQAHVKQKVAAFEADPASFAEDDDAAILARLFPSRSWGASDPPK